jgi:hypothetical protein
MSMIFPGMDPYLEDPQIWPGVHASFMVYLRDHLLPALRPRYIATVEERVYVEGPDCAIIPDVWLRQTYPGKTTAATVVADEDAPVVVDALPLEVHEPYVTILDRRSNQRIVTVIEVVSPTNKYAGPGRQLYAAKQQEVLRSDTHLVEIDLLRTGPHVLAIPEATARRQGPYDYLISVNRATKQPQSSFELYLRGLRQRLPRIKIPLAGDDPDVKLDLQAVLEQTYAAGYRERLNYAVPCNPPLAAADQAWANQLIQEAERQAS